MVKHSFQMKCTKCGKTFSYYSTHPMIEQEEYDRIVAKALCPECKKEQENKNDERLMTLNERMKLKDIMCKVPTREEIRNSTDLWGRTPEEIGELLANTSAISNIMVTQDKLNRQCVENLWCEECLKELFKHKRFRIVKHIYYSGYQGDLIGRECILHPAIINYKLMARCTVYNKRTKKIDIDHRYFYDMSFFEEITD